MKPIVDGKVNKKLLQQSEQFQISLSAFFEICVEIHHVATPFPVLVEIRVVDELLV